MIINLLDLTNICDKVYIHAFYNLADTVCKFVCNMVISQYNDQEAYHRENMDLQSVSFVSSQLKSIRDFEMSNPNLTLICANLVKYVTKNFKKKLPIETNTLKLELLKKMLPLNLDQQYMDALAYSRVVSNTSRFDHICVLFMDIVNYTELAKLYDSTTVFNLLNNLYNHFDNFIKKYAYLQKIETIGDAYMVVGDIFKNSPNKSVVVKEMIVLALELLYEVKTIETPDGKPLCIRIGINIGSVNIGILGNEIPRLCVVGNTVNVASRLQSTAEDDTIQISEIVYDIASNIDFDEKIEFQRKDNVFLKNIGSVSTYTIRV